MWRWALFFVNDTTRMANEFETISFLTQDGVTCNLKHLKSSTSGGEPVLLVHGAGVRGNIFNPPTAKNLITTLAEAGYDVWLENWRGSIEVTPNEWDLDKVARYDHPAAVQKVVELTGFKHIKAIIHCQGSTSFMISVMLGLVPQVRLIISNAVSLHPVVPSYSVFKLNVFVPVVKLLFRYLNPQWGLKAPGIKEKLLRLIVNATHREKDTLVGKFVSFTYGAGFPALWELDNLDKPTMDWIQHEFANVPLTFFTHITRCVKAGVLVPNQKDATTTYAPDLPPLTARVVLFGGRKNKCFLAESQERSFDYLQRVDPGVHRLYILEQYSHLDVFLGKNAHQDVFPLMLQELSQL
jgi:pimeloyl-ACP methyl ester carboxylesterase